MLLFSWIAPLSLLLGTVLGSLNDQSPNQQVETFFNTSDSRHTNNWAVLACASRYWFNYRHMANTLAMYRNIKRLGIPDSNIILMLADDVACNARNIFPATVYGNPNRQLDLYGDSVEVDYSGYEVTVENFLRTLTGRLNPNVPPNKRLLSDASSNVFIYLTGHGGNEFLKFQDNEELSAFDIADAVEQMWEKRRYNRLLFMIDTCQANTMYSKFYSPNIIATGSSKLGQDSLSYDNDYDIGVAVIDSFTHFVLSYLESIGKTSQVNMQQLFDAYDAKIIRSDPGISTALSSKPPRDILVTDFLGGVARVEVGERPSSTLQDLARSASGWVPSGHAATSDDRVAHDKPFKRLSYNALGKQHGLNCNGVQSQSLFVTVGALFLLCGVVGYTLMCQTT